MVKLAIIAVLLLGVANESSSIPLSLNATNSSDSESDRKPCTPSVMVPRLSPVTPPPPLLAMISVIAKPPACQGALHLVLNFTDKGPLCYRNHVKLISFQDTFCAHLGCDKSGHWIKSRTSMGNEIVGKGFIQNSTCETLAIKCNALAKSKELVGYKTVTGLLILAILLALLLRFAQKRCTSLYSKLFKRRNREWIGPTQSQSVSFHRAQSGMHPNSNSARHSYPALERLSIQPSRESSSNRNSDCDSYN